MEEIEDNVEGKIVVSRGRLSGREIEGLREGGARGTVFSQLNVEDIEGLFDEEVYSGVTGRLDRGIVVLLLDGFGTEPMDEENWAFFKSLDGAPAYLNGITQIRAGVVRPEFIISSRLRSQDPI
jgi:hypothetical protein